MRLLVAFFPNWPITALGLRDDEPAAVVEKDRIISCSTNALTHGVANGQRRRQAEHLCPQLVIAPRDPIQEVRRFEPIVTALTGLTPSVEVLQPGCCAFDVRGPARYFGGEVALVDAVRDTVTPVLSNAASPCRIGIAEGRFAAVLAARQDVVVPKGKTTSFLAPLSIALLPHVELVELLVLLGITTLGAFTALDTALVEERFGVEGRHAQLSAQGGDHEALRPSGQLEELCAQEMFEPPIERVDTAAFVARALAETLVSALEERGLVCTQLCIEAETDHGERLERLWRSEESFTPEGLVERLRWQLEGWFAGSVPEQQPSVGITLLRVSAKEVTSFQGRQLGLLSERRDVEVHARRNFDRLRGLLGPQALFIATRKGGRGPADRVALTPWGEHTVPSVLEPWPGHHPLPAPACVYERPLAAEVRDNNDVPVRVLQRGVVPNVPEKISIEGGAWSEIVAWSGPWLYDERAWDARSRRRRSRFQILTGEHVAHLCVVETNRWFVEATYD